MDEEKDDHIQVSRQADSPSEDPGSCNISPSQHKPESCLD